MDVFTWHQQMRLAGGSLKARRITRPSAFKFQYTSEVFTRETMIPTWGSGKPLDLDQIADRMARDLGLTEREKDVFIRRFIKKEELREIGRSYGLSEQSIYAIARGVVRKAQQWRNSKTLH